MEKCQIIKCKCGSIFAGSMEPHCYTDRDWQKEMRNYVTNRGCTVELVEPKDFRFEECICKEKEAQKKKEETGQTDLFTA